MNAVRHILKRARRRAVIDGLLRNAARGLLGGIVAAFAMLAADRGFNLALPWWAFLIPVAVGLLTGVMISIAMAPSLLQVAVRLDRALKLKDQLGTAKLIEARRVIESPFMPIVLRDAEQLAASLECRAAFPIRMRREWALVPVLAAALAAGVLLVPARTVAVRSNQEQSAEQVAKVLEPAQREIVQTIREVAEEIPESAAADEALSEQLAALDRLAEQLAEQPRTEQEFRTQRDEAAATLEAVSREMDEQAQRDFAALDELSRSMSNTASQQPPMSTEEFLDAIKRGEFGEASDLIDQLLDDPDALSEAQREQLAREFRDLNQQVRDAEAQSPTEVSESDQSRQSDLEQTLRDAGIDEQALKEMIEKSGTQSPEQTQKALEQNGVDEEVARKLARQIEQVRREQQVRDQARRDAQDLADRMNETADELSGAEEESQESAAGGEQRDSQPPPSGTDEQAGPGEAHAQPEQSQTKSGDQQKSGPGKSAKSDPQGQEQQPGAAESKQTESTKGSQGANEAGRQAEPGKTPKPGSEETGVKESQQPGAEQGAESVASGESPDPQTVPQRVPTPGQGNEKLPHPASNDEAQENHSPAERTAGDQSQGSESAQQPPTGRRGLVEKLKELADRKNRARQAHRDSEQLRRAAERIAEQLTDDERRELERWARQWDKQQRPPAGDENASGSAGASAPLNSKPPRLAPTNIETVDAGGEEIGDEIVASWLADRGQEPSPEARAQARASIRTAQREAERAVNQAAVPSRYHDLIRKYFGRLPQTVEPSAPAESSTSGSGASP